MFTVKQIKKYKKKKSIKLFNFFINVFYNFIRAFGTLVPFYQNNEKSNSILIYIFNLKKPKIKIIRFYNRFNTIF